MRFDVELDDELVAKAMKIYQLPTERGVVELALRRLLESMTNDENVAMEGTGWPGDLDDMRSVSVTYDRPKHDE